MPTLILYLLKVNVALALFYLAYHFALRRLTFYGLNRCFLLFGIVFSTAYPFLDVSELFNQHQDLASAYINTVPAWVTTPAIPEQASAFGYWQIPVFLFCLGTGAMASRLLLQLLSLYKIHACSQPKTYIGIGFRQVNHITQAFSFWQAIYLNPAQHKAAELESILRHEQVHVKGWHTLDVLLAELNTVFYWFNPGAWLLKKAVKENLEFIADQKVICAGVDRKAYQYLLLKVVGAPEPQIANQFNFPSLKRRIAMMNKKQNSLLYITRYAVLVPLIAAPILFVACSEEEADSVSPGVTAGTTKEQDDIRVEEVVIPDVEAYIPDASTAPEDYKAFLKRNPGVKHMGWISGVTNGTVQRLIVIELNSGGSELYDLNDEGSMATVERKYGKMPALPPPPPPVKKDKKYSPPVIRQDHKEEMPYIPDETNQTQEYEAFLKRNPEVKQVGWTLRDESENKTRFIHIYLQSGASEVYNLYDSNNVAAAENKYGKLPTLPPPPPPVRNDDN